MGRDNVIDKTIFDKFQGPCADAPGQRSPNELCGSAKSIACFAPWGHENSVFDLVHANFVKSVRNSYRMQAAEVRAVMVDGLKKFCPVNCEDWILSFQTIMLPHQYRMTPNCFPLAEGGI